MDKNEQAIRYAERVDDYLRGFLGEGGSDNGAMMRGWFESVTGSASNGDGGRSTAGDRVSEYTLREQSRLIPQSWGCYVDESLIDQDLLRRAHEIVRGRAAYEDIRETCVPWRRAQ